MLTLLNNIECFSPTYIGKKDILIAGEKIIKIGNFDHLKEIIHLMQVIPCDGYKAFPGIIDQHVHIIGGGGEDGPTSRIAEIDFEDIIMAGVTTLVGVLGVDSFTRSLSNLLAKAKALELLGLTTYVYTGSYAIPTVTFTNSISNDLIFIDKVIGTGEVAISDHRSTLSDFNEFIKLSAETHIAGLIGGKAGVVHIHVGDGKEGLTPLFNLLNMTELEKEQFVPTHLNRNEKLFNQAIEYCKSGGNIDLTAGEEIGITVPECIHKLLSSKVDISKITISSDANGSIPNHGVGKIQSLYNDVKDCILKQHIPPQIAFQFVTENVAKVLKLYPKKGVLKEGCDADIIITDDTFKIEKLFCKGKLVINKGKRI